MGRAQHASNCQLSGPLWWPAYTLTIAEETGLGKPHAPPNPSARSPVFGGVGVWLPSPSLPRKEVIQPQLPLRLPCYDFVPVTGPTFGGCLLAVGSPTSGVTSSHDVTGGVYKARERIHRSVADPRLLATPASCRRVAACNPNYDRLCGIRSTSRLRCPLYLPL